MGICWFCHWGWPKPIADIYKKALKALDGDDRSLLYGPAHGVWADENFHSAEWCIEHFDEYSGNGIKGDLAIVKQSLKELAKLPLDLRSEPEDYDGEHPRLYPPSKDMEMVKDLP